MASASRISEKLLVELAQYDTILAPNARLARFLSDQLAGKNAGSVSRFPAILSFDQWFQAVYAEALVRGLCSSQIVMTLQEERALWGQVIEEAEAGNPIVLSSAIDGAQKAYVMLSDSLLSVQQEQSAFDSLPDARRFAQWVPLFLTLCEQRSLISLSDAKRKTLTLDSSRLTRYVNCKIALVGFEKMTPLQQSLVEHLSNGEVAHYNLEDKPSGVVVHGFDSEEKELTSAYRWAKQYRGDHPGKSVAVVIKDLQQHRLQAQRLAAQVFYGYVDSSRTTEQGDAYNFSMGYSLGATDIVAAQRLLISAFLRPISIDDWTLLIGSPYLNLGSDHRWFGHLLLRAMYDSSEREFRFDEIGALIDWYLQRNPSFSSEALTHILSDYANSSVEIKKIVRGRAKRKPPSIWFTQVMNCVVDSGWPRAFGLSSGEYQQYQALQDALAAFERFDSVLGELTLDEACQAWFRFVSGIVFQPQTVVDVAAPPVQILGLLETAGQRFDAVWITGFSEVQWPQTVSPNPFIPLQLQVQYAMPSASHELELAFSRSMTGSLLRSADTIVVSFPSQIDEVDVGLSPLVTETIAALGFSSEVQCAEQTDLVSAGPEDKAQPVLEELSDTRGEPWNLTQSRESDIQLLPSGLTAINDVLVNPLEAYLKHRLNAKPLWAAKPGIQPIERGNVVHGVLESVWRETVTSEKLRQAQGSSFRQSVKALVQRHLSSELSKRYRELPEYIVNLEAEVSTDIVEAWIALDLSMPDVEILGLEVPVSLVLQTPEGACAVRGRIDRLERRQCDVGPIDMISDYKTGQVQTPGWLNDPLLDPQLPAYALALLSLNNTGLQHAGKIASLVPDQLRALYLAQLRPGYIGIKGFTWETDCAAAMPGLRSVEDISWQEVTSHWRQSLEQAASMLLRGEAIFDAMVHGYSDKLTAFTRAGFTVQDVESA